MSVRSLRITAGDVVIAAALNQTATADLVWAALPIEASASTWGDEVYFGTSIEAEEDDARDVVELGDVGFWPPGQALCLFFGPTPASRGDEIRPASAVNVIGRIHGDPTVLRQVRSGDRVVVERAWPPRRGPPAGWLRYFADQQASSLVESGRRKVSGDFRTC